MVAAFALTYDASDKQVGMVTNVVMLKDKDVANRVMDVCVLPTPAEGHAASRKKQGAAGPTGAAEAAGDSEAEADAEREQREGDAAKAPTTAMGMLERHYVLTGDECGCVSVPGSQGRCANNSEC